MGKIEKTMLVNRPINEGIAFQQDVNKVIGLFQNEGLVVSVQYGHTDSQFSALIIGTSKVAG